MRDASLVLTRSDGASLTIGGADWGVLELEGMDAPAIELFSEKSAVGDGDVITGKRVAARTIACKARARSTRTGKELRSRASAFFNPAATFDAQCSYDGVTRTARDCQLKALALPTASLYAPLALTFTLLCPSGYLDGGGLHGQDVNSVQPRLGWPFVSLAGVGFLPSVFNFSKSIKVDNTGAAPTWVRAMFTVSGPDGVTNPKLICGGSYVRVLCTLRAGDQLEIDTEKRTVRLNGQNALNKVDKQSDFAGMRMELGLNTIGFDADAHDNLLCVRVYYAIRYNGM